MGKNELDEQKEIIARCKLIFDSFLKDFTITNNVYMAKLTSHLSKKEYFFIMQDPFAIEWVDKCLALVSEDFSKVDPKVISFMLSFCSLLIQNEWILSKIKELKIMDRILDICSQHFSQFNASIKLSCIRLLASISQYSLGLCYIHNSKAWRILVDYCTKEYTVYVVREASQIVFELIYKFSVKTKDEKVVLEILNEIIKPLSDNIYKSCETVTSEESDTVHRIIINVDDSEMLHKLSSSLDLLSFILQQTVDCPEKTNIAYLCKIHHDLETLLWKYTAMTLNEYFTEKIFKTLTSYLYAILIYDKWTNEEIAPESFHEFGINFYNIMKICTTRQQFVVVLRITELNYILWKRLGTRVPKKIMIENELMCFENQLILFHMMPLIYCIKSKDKLPEPFEAYITKLFEMSSGQTQRLRYEYRNAVSHSDGKNLKLLADLASKSIHGILSMKNILDRDQAVVMFQSMCYASVEFVLISNLKPEFMCANSTWNKSDDPSTEGMELILEIPNLLYSTFIGLQSLIKQYRITWSESIETICIINVSVAILENPSLTSRLAVQALKLVQLAIEHFLAPNMALLVDNLDGSGLVGVGPIIAKRCHDPTWEVRDTALELVTSIANISRLKFSPFQKFIAENKLCEIIYDMALHDVEYYVRASALKCLSEMVTINLLWENYLSKLNLIEELFSLSYSEYEGIVRKEAVNVLSMIYKYRKIPDEHNDTLFSTMAYAVVDDLHWEVQISALRFWKVEITKQFTNQGMIDGIFPPVTFSKEHKKIVTLTEKEIELRIIKIFNILSKRGCLGVILKCLDSDYNLEMIKFAVCIIKKMLLTLKSYDYEAIFASPDEPLNNVEKTENATLEAKEQTEEQYKENKDTNVDDIIESILDSKDISLLVFNYENQMKLHDNEDKKNIDKDYYKKFAHVRAKDFIAGIKEIDLDQLVQSQEEWLSKSETFTSLLDDILCIIKPHEDDDTFISDCY